MTDSFHYLIILIHYLHIFDLHLRFWVIIFRMITMKYRVIWYQNFHNLILNATRDALWTKNEVEKLFGLTWNIHNTFIIHSQYNLEWYKSKCQQLIAIQLSPLNHLISSYYFPECFIKRQRLNHTKYHTLRSQKFSCRNCFPQM